MVAPFPFERLPRVAREDAVALRRVARALPSDHAAMRERLGGLLGGAVALTPDVLHRCPPGELHRSLGEPLVAVVLEGASPAARIAVELAPGLAEWIVLRTLGGEAEGTHGQAPLRELERGVLAWASAHVLGPSTWFVRDVVTSASALQDVIGDEGSVVWSAWLRVDQRAGVVRVWVADGAPLTPSPSTTTRPWLSLELRLLVDVVTSTADELATLALGDVVLLDRCDALPLRRASLCARGSRAGYEVARDDARDDAGDDGGWRVVQRMPPEPGAQAPKERRVDDQEQADTLAAVGDAPVELSVELARFSMTLRELAALRPGEVVPGGRAIGERVTLRAGDRAVAEGELVDLDGEVGVRLTALFD